MLVLQLLRGGSEEMLQSLHLQSDPALYLFTREGAATTVSSSPSPLAVCSFISVSLSFNEQKKKKNSSTCVCRPPTTTGRATERC